MLLGFETYYLKTLKNFIYARQTCSQVKVWGEKHIFNGASFIYYMFETNVSGNKKIWGELPLNDRHGYRSVPEKQKTF